MADAATAPSPGAEETGTAATDTGAAAQAADTPTPEAAAGTDANPASSSAADKGEKSEREKMLDVTRKALEPKPAKDTASPSHEAKPGDDKTAKADDKPADRDPDADLPFHKHPRWQQRTKELNDTRAALAAIEPKARQYDALEEFRGKSNLSVDEVIEGYRAMALLKNDPVKAHAYFQNILSNIEQSIGKVLPADLKQAVEAGEITQERAEELSQTRAADQRLAADRDQTRQQQDADRQQRELQQLNDRNVAAVNEWEAAVKKSDPDYDKKAPLIADRILAIIQSERKYPKNEQEAVALSKRAYEDVSQRFATFMPAKKPTPPAPRGLSVPTKAVPKTRLEATRAALGQL